MILNIEQDCGLFSAMAIQTQITAEEKESAHWDLNLRPDLLDSDNALQAKLIEHCDFKGDERAVYEKRVLRVTISENLEPFSGTALTRTKDYAQVFYDILRVHHWLSENAKILHRDLHPGNIMLRRIGDKIYGVLNDFDRASESVTRTGDRTLNQRTGTRPYMAIDMLDDTWRLGHMYRHDLESLFYIILSFACYNKPFSKWFTGTRTDVFDAKYTFFRTLREPDIPIRHHFRVFEPGLRQMFSCIRRVYLPRILPRLGLDPDISFDQESMYEKFEKAMCSYNGVALETR
ncbi:hypothetical protein BDP27DRAFT_1363441 [Rhodocollybia butyracea]|uniref:Protein kinase domain-containing protein n=1 Tax=Rhodocollybia butyracea TaxID=206335 RepID=A0A9P5PTZ4_9AGAR|nr:hypothetical protein BDP27DRAFT_1363441 [Rhodocollybia butyracea]